MKLSQFKRVPKRRRLIFGEGGETSFSQSPSSELVGEVAFEEIDIDWLTKNQPILSEQLSTDKSETEILRILLPIISDIEVDVTVEELDEMMSNPSAQLASLATAVTEVFEEIKTLFLTLNDAIDKYGYAVKTNETNTEEEAISVTLEEAKSDSVPTKDEYLGIDINQAIDELVEQFSRETNREKRIELLKAITELQAVRDTK